MIESERIERVAKVMYESFGNVGAFVWDDAAEETRNVWREVTALGLKKNDECRARADRFVHGKDEVSEEHQWTWVEWGAYVRGLTADHRAEVEKLREVIAAAQTCIGIMRLRLLDHDDVAGGPDFVPYRSVVETLTAAGYLRSMERMDRDEDPDHRTAR